MRSPWGRVLKSIREDENAARALGKNVALLQDAEPDPRRRDRLDRRADAGAQKQSAQPGQFATTLTFFCFVIIVLGGLGRVKGPIIGTVIFFFVIQFVDNVLNQATRLDKLPDWLIDPNNYGVVQVHRRRPRPRPPRGVPAAGHLRRPTRAGVRCPLIRSPPTSPAAVAIEGRPGVAKPDPILVADGVRRRFGGLVAVDVDHVEVQRNEITALIGPNGAGKTTFFNLLTGFDEPDGGTWQFDGHDVAGVPPYKVARLGMVRTFQLTKSLARLIGHREHAPRRRRPTR